MVVPSLCHVIASPRVSSLSGRHRSLRGRSGPVSSDMLARRAIAVWHVVRPSTLGGLVVRPGASVGPRRAEPVTDIPIQSAAARVPPAIINTALVLNQGSAGEPCFQKNGCGYTQVWFS